MPKKPALPSAGAGEVLIHPLTIAYTRLQGLPSAAPTDRSSPGSSPKPVKQNIREILTGGTREVTLAFGTPRPLSAGANRKALAKETENQVRRMLVALNRGTPLPGAGGVAEAALTRLHNAEQVALGVGHHGVAVRLAVDRRTEPDQPRPLG